MHSEDDSRVLQWYSLDMKPLHSLQVEMKPIIPHVIDKKEEELNPEKGEKNRKKREFKDIECKTKGKVLSIGYQDMSLQTFTFGL